MAPGHSFSRHLVTSSFASAFAISWLGAFLVAAPHLLRHESLPNLTGILMFPVLLLGPSIASIALTGIVDGREGFRDLRVRMFRLHFPLSWYVTLLIPPGLVLSIMPPIFSSWVSRSVFSQPISKS